MRFANYKTDDIAEKYIRLTLITSVKWGQQSANRFQEYLKERGEIKNMIFFRIQIWIAVSALFTIKQEQQTENSNKRK